MKFGKTYCICFIMDVYFRESLGKSPCRCVINIAQRIGRYEGFCRFVENMGIFHLIILEFPYNFSISGFRPGEIGVR